MAGKQLAYGAWLAFLVASAFRPLATSHYQQLQSL